MKKGYYLVVILLFSSLLLMNVSFASAAFECSDGLDFDENQREIKKGNKKTINGLGIAVFDSDESSVLQKVSAELLLDAEKVTLTNDSSSQEIELLKGNYDVDLENVTGSDIQIEVEGDSEIITTDEITNIDNIYVFLVSSSGVYPGEDVNVVAIIGATKLSLSNTDNPSEVVTIDSKDYLIGLTTASDSEATIKVSKCSSNEIVEIADVTNSTTNNSTTTNTTTNETIADNPDENLEDTNETTTETTEINSADEIDGEKKPFYQLPSSNVLFFVGFIVLVGIIVFIYLRSRARVKTIVLKRKEDEDNKEERY